MLYCTYFSYNFRPRMNRNKYKSQCIHDLKQNVIDAAVNKCIKQLAACVCVDNILNTSHDSKKKSGQIKCN